MVRRAYAQRSVFEVLRPDGDKLWDAELRTIDEVLDDEGFVDLLDAARRRRYPLSGRRGRLRTPATVVLGAVLIVTVELNEEVADGLFSVVFHVSTEDGQAVLELRPAPVPLDFERPVLHNSNHIHWSRGQVGRRVITFSERGTTPSPTKRTRVLRWFPDGP